MDINYRDAMAETEFDVYIDADMLELAKLVASAEGISLRQAVNDQMELWANA